MRRVLQATAVVWIGVLFWTVFAAPYLFLPAAIGLACLAASIPEEETR